MNHVTRLILAGLLATGLADAQTSTGAQAGASAQSQTGASVQAGRSGVQASGSGSASVAANGSAQAGPANMAISNGTIMNTKLNSALDAKKNKPGDRIEAQLTEDVKQNGKVLLPKGSKLIGHVAQAQAREKGQAQSALGVAFDQAQLRNGQTMPLHATIQALAVSQSAAEALAANSFASEDIFTGGGGQISTGGSGSMVGGGGLIGGAGHVATGTVVNTAGSIADTAGTAGAGVGSTLNTAAHSAGAIGGLNAAGALTSNSQGVFGLQGISLDSSASSATQGSMIVSATRNVHLDSGTQMLLRVQGQSR